jgi:hypothetical protein
LRYGQRGHGGSGEVFLDVIAVTHADQGASDPRSRSNKLDGALCVLFEAGKSKSKGSGQPVAQAALQ